MSFEPLEKQQGIQRNYSCEFIFQMARSNKNLSLKKIKDEALLTKIIVVSKQQKVVIQLKVLDQVINHYYEF